MNKTNLNIKINNELNLDELNKLGKFTRELRKEASEIPKEGTDITEIIDFIEKKIFDNGYLPAFPATVSINEIAAHYTVFDEGITLKKGDLIKIDFGVSKNGLITDNAFTLEIGSNEHEKLLKANMDGLNSALELANIGVSMKEIGKAVNLHATKNNFNTIHNLSGHEIGINNLHCGLSVPNYDNNDSSTIKNNTELAIEPFFTYGLPQVKNAGNGNILHLKNYKPVRDPIAKKLLNYIKKYYPKLPFSKRWLVKDIISKLRNDGAEKEAFDKRKVIYGLKILKMQGIILEYEALATIDGKLVSQFEDTVVFIDNKKSIITRIK